MNYRRSNQHMWYHLGWSLIFLGCVVVADRLYEYSDVICRFFCKLIMAIAMFMILWFLVYIQTHAEDFLAQVEELKTKVDL